ncbi:MAG: HYD1 signature containing ADP-ribosyltransferase family protein, partial [Saprospiraceae bacterium]
GQSCTAPLVTAYSGPCPQTKYTEGFNQQSVGGLYTYDNSGNLSYDPNKKLTFYYNYHNLPYRIIGAENDELQILYGADGSLLQRKYLKDGAQISKRDYLRGKEYKSDIPESVHHEDGRVIKVGSSWLYEYWIKDHLGNVRVTFSDINGDGILTPFGDIKSRNDYYSFGMEWNNRWELSDTISPVNKYRYNGKEFVEEMGWKNLDYGLRSLDPVLGRWFSVDNKSAMYPAMSPYVYSGNNPIAFIDMLGDSISPYTIRSITPTVKPSDKLTNPIAKVGMQMVEGAVEGVNYMVRSPFYGRGEGVPKVFEDGHTIKGSEESQTMAVDGMLTIAPIVGNAGKPVAVAAKGGGNVLRHYTNEAGYNAIMKSGELFASTGAKNARYGSGQYLTDLMSNGLSSGQVSRRLFGVPWNGSKVTHFIDINVGGLNTIKNAPFNYLLPGTNSLPIGGRIVNHGVSIFK